MELANIETRHLAKLEADMIRFALDSADLWEVCEHAVLSAEATDEVLEHIEQNFRDLFEDELVNEIEQYIEEESDESASDYDPCGVGYHLADCFRVKVTRELVNEDEPDFERCAVRVLAAYAIEAYPDGLNGLYVELGSE